MVKPDAVARAERLLGERADAWTPVVGRGYSIAERRVVQWVGGGSAFLKLAVTDDLARRLRDEHRVYAWLRGPVAPRLLGWEDGDRPLLVLEDMTPGAEWPPPWSRRAVDAVLAALAEIATLPRPSGLPRLEDESLPGWDDVDLDAVSGLGLCSRRWLEAALPRLVAAAEAAQLAGDDLVHCDVRSDNLCIRGGRAVLFDWNFAAVGDAAFDVAFRLPSLALEGGPQPAELATPAAAALAATVAGFFAALAPLSPPEGAPTVRAIQRAQLEVALPWAAQVLDLPPPQ